MRKRKSAHVDDAISDARDAATERIRIAGYAVERRQSELQSKTLLWLKYEIENAVHRPVTLAALEEDVKHPQQLQKKTWSSALEGVSRCVAAHHRAFVATELDNCLDVANSLHLHVRALMSKIKDHWNRSLAIGLVHDFVESRATGMTLRQVLDAAVATDALAGHVCFWDNITAQERQACLDILEDLLSQVRVQSHVLQGDLKACKQ